MNYRLFHYTILVLIYIIVPTEILGQNSRYVDITDYISFNDLDVSMAIQRAIDQNPNRVIFFPDGLYKISTPILTSADPHKSVCLELSNYAIIQPKEGWNHEEAMIRLGGKEPSNTVLIPGSNYYLSGGIIDCAGVAKGISIDSGRETIVRETSIKNAVLGIHIKKGANNGSSDADIYNVNITGNMNRNSIGILVEGYDNTFSNIRIYRTQFGVMSSSGGNSFRNIHALYGSSDDSIYEDGYGFVNKKGNNWYDLCYSDQYATGFCIESGYGIFHDCYAFWYSKRGLTHTAFRSYLPFNSIVTNFTMGVNSSNATERNIILDEIDSSVKGSGYFQNIRVTNPQFITTDTHKKYIKD